jgi:hypothetical protein
MRKISGIPSGSRRSGSEEGVNLRDDGRPPLVN